MPRVLSSDEQKELGKRHYARREFDKALDAFTNGIDASPRSDIRLHDYRAATFEKLGRMNEALADSRRMIRSNENDPRGYLRAGQLLMKMERKEQALLIYGRGLKYVPVSHPQQKLLKEVHKRLNTELSSPTAADPFTKLPAEIVGMIFRDFKFHELVSCLRVSRSWKQYFESIPSLWTRMDLLRIGNRQYVKAASVKRYIKLAQEKVVYARLARFDSRAMLNQLLKVCKSLEKLELINCPFGSDSIMEAAVAGHQLKALVVHSDIEVLGNTLYEILMSRRQLEEVRVHNCVRIHVSDIPYTIVPPQPDPQLPNLRMLDIRGIDTELFRCFFIRTIYCAPNLVDLHLKFNHESSIGPSWVPTDFFSNLTKLERLKLVSIFVRSFPLLPPSLRSLDLSFKSSLDGIRVERVENDLPLLEHLHLHDHSGDLIQFLGPLDHVPELSETGDSSSSQTKDLDSGLAQPSSSLRSKIRTLTLGLAEPPSRYEFSSYMSHPRLRQLEELIIAGCAGECLDDLGAQTLHQLRNLKRLTIDSASITGVGLKGLVKVSLGTLEELQLIACDHVGHDALEWIARQDIAVRVVERRRGRTMI